MKIAIVTDSTSDIPPRIARDCNIHVIPNLLMVENQTLLDGEGISREEFYLRLPTFSQPVSTAAPSPNLYIEKYTELVESGVDTILSIHPSPKLSAIFSVASLAAQNFSRHVKVLDSNSVTLGLGFQALAAAEAVIQGAALPDILALIERVKNHTRVIALLDTLDYVRRSGRVNWVTAALGSMLGLRALIEVRNGLVNRIGLSRSRHQAVNQLIDHLVGLGSLERFAFLHTTDPDPTEMGALLEKARLIAGTPLIVPVTTVVGTHVGPKGMGFAVVTA
jgi:DegV family protein with EDD domain